LRDVWSGNWRKLTQEVESGELSIFIHVLLKSSPVTRKGQWVQKFTSEEIQAVMKFTDQDKNAAGKSISF